MAVAAAARAATGAFSIVVWVRGVKEEEDDLQRSAQRCVALVLIDSFPLSFLDIKGLAWRGEENESAVPLTTHAKTNKMNIGIDLIEEL